MRNKLIDNAINIIENKGKGFSDLINNDYLLNDKTYCLLLIGLFFSLPFGNEENIKPISKYLSMTNADFIDEFKDDWFKIKEIKNEELVSSISYGLITYLVNNSFKKKYDEEWIILKNNNKYIITELLNNMFMKKVFNTGFEGEIFTKAFKSLLKNTTYKDFVKDKMNINLLIGVSSLKYNSFFGAKLDKRGINKLDTVRGFYHEYLFKCLEEPTMLELNKDNNIEKILNKFESNHPVLFINLERKIIKNYLNSKDKEILNNINKNRL